MPQRGRTAPRKEPSRHQQPLRRRPLQSKRHRHQRRHAHRRRPYRRRRPQRQRRHLPLLLRSKRQPCRSSPSRRHGAPSRAWPWQRQPPPRMWRLAPCRRRRRHRAAAWLPLLRRPQPRRRCPVRPLFRLLSPRQPLLRPRQDRLRCRVDTWSARGPLQAHPLLLRGLRPPPVQLRCVRLQERHWAHAQARLKQALPRRAGLSPERTAGVFAAVR